MTMTKIINRIPFEDQKVLVVGMFKCGCPMSVLAQVFNASLKVVEDIIREKL